MREIGADTNGGLTQVHQHLNRGLSYRYQLLMMLITNPTGYDEVDVAEAEQTLQAE